MNDRTVLVVDDYAQNRIIFRTILEFHGYRVVEAREGRESIRLADACRPDLILMDIGMPGMDGWEAIQRLRRGGEKTRHIPIVVLTANVTDECREKARAEQCDGFLGKPCDPQTLVEEVERLIGPAPAIAT